MSQISRQLMEKAVALHRQGQLMASVKQYDLVLAMEPRNPVALHLKGLVLFQLGQLDASVEILSKSIKLNPGSAAAYNTRGLAYQRLGRRTDAFGDFGRALALDGKLAEAHCNKGNVLREMGRFSEAADACRAAIAINPKVAEFHNSLGIVHKEQRNWQAALACFDDALALRPQYVDALVNRGNALKELERLEDALAAYDSAIASRPDHLEAFVNRGNTLRESGRLDEAAASYQRALEMRPDHPMAWLGLAKIDLEAGRFDDAETKYEKVSKLAPGLVEPLHGLALVKKFTPNDPLISELERRLADRSLPAADRSWLHAAYAKICDDLGRYDEAIEHFTAAKSLSKPDFSPERHRAAHSALKRLFTPAFFAERRGFGDPDERPVFVVGMPRSGTTLVEQILASHRDVEGLGELMDMPRIADDIGGGLKNPEHFISAVAKLQAGDIARLAERYRKAYVRSGRSATRLVDKLPHNFQLLGLIALIFPTAHVVHCRRNPLDTCVSIYMQRYIKTHDYAGDLGDLGRYYRDYEDLMMHWREVLPIPIHDCVYEDLVGSFEQSVAAMLSSLGLEWDPNCLNYHTQDHRVRTASLWQVRQPLYSTSVERWRRYEKHLGPLKEALEL